MNPTKSYIKKPIVVQAKQLDEDVKVETLEGWFQGHAGDYLVIGVMNERYVVKKQIFELTYDEVDD